MNKNQLFSVGLKLFSFQLVSMLITQLVRVVSLSKTPTHLDNPFIQNQTFMLPIYIGLMFLYGFSAWILFNYSNELTHKILKEESSNEVITKELLIQLVLIFQGVSFLFVVIPNCLSFRFNNYFQNFKGIFLMSHAVIF